VTATEVLDCKQSAASAGAKKSGQGGQGELFKMMTGVTMVYVPYRGSASGLAICSAVWSRTGLFFIPGAVRILYGDYRVSPMARADASRKRA
jgi:hypothetical protein